VLRITIPTRADCPVYVLEGRLAGDWVQELLRISCKLCPGTNTVFDIEHVFYVDSLGGKALQWLNRLGSKFVARNAYGVDLCERLHLHRLIAVESAAQEEHKRRSVESPPTASSHSRSLSRGSAKSRHGECRESAPEVDAKGGPNRHSNVSQQDGCRFE
jgi:hypothetical protein